jgi:BirA family transcriptional regulator, biotin operon repressor / biotin---[acetyl-CoA-carboxylase] ligase
MDQHSLESALADLHLPAIHFFPTIGSTNDQAWRWVDSGAPHCALVIADEQTAGRGRLQRRWVTVAGSGLAFTLILKSPPLEAQLVQRLTGLAALTLCNVLRTKYGLSAQIKWPNDILLNQRKLAGVLVEARWEGDILKAAVIGIGINIAPESVNPKTLPAKRLNFPATCVEDGLGYPVDRLELLRLSLLELLDWLPRLSSQDFINRWEASLAYHDQWVELLVDPTTPSASHEVVTPPIQLGKVIGLTPEGSLKLMTTSGKLVIVQMGEIYLRPAHADPLS